MKKMFKSILLILLAFSLVFSFVGCSKEKSESEYYGTWGIVSAENNGSKFTVNELEAMGDDSLSDTFIILKEGGKAYLLENGRDDIVIWSATNDGVKIGEIDCKLENNLLRVEKNGIVLNFKKISDSQEIPNE